MKQDTKEEPIQQTIDLKVARKKAEEAAGVNNCTCGGSGGSGGGWPGSGSNCYVT